MDTHKTYKAGDSITLLPEWQDEGDCLWTITVLEDKGNRVFAEWTKDGCNIKQRETIGKYMIANGQ